MAFYGFNFRQSAAGGTGFTSDPAGTLGVPSLPAGVAFPTAFDFGGGKVFNAGYRNTASSTPVGTAPFASGSNTSNTTDMRLAGVHGLTGNTVIWRVEVPNGTYDVRLGAGAPGSSALQGVRLTFGTGPSDFVEVLSNASGTATAVPNNSEMDGSGAILTDAQWRDQYVGSATAGTTRITVKDGFIDVQRATTANTNASLRHFSFQVVGGALQDVTLDTDDTGAKVDTTGTFTAGSAAVTIPATAGIVPGMLAISLNVPFGTTVASLGAQASGGVVTSLTLSSGSGVTAGMGAIRFARAAQFFEKEALGKLVAPITTVNGATVGLAVLATDGVTPHPYLGIKLADPAATGARKPYVYVKAAGFPSASPHAFKISQPDTSGDFTGSPHITSLSLPVIASPTKPSTGFWSAVSSACYNLRKYAQTKFLDGAWPGYKGQAITLSRTAVSYSDLVSKMGELAALAGGGKWFSIIPDPAGNWTDSYTTTSVFNFKPEQGGGLVIGAGVTSPLIYGNLTIPPPRGVEMRDLVIPGNQSPGNVPTSVSAASCLRMDPVSGQSVGTLGVFVGRRLKMGALWDPAMTDAALALGTTPTTGGVIGIKSVRGMDQLSLIDCDFRGTADAIQVTCTRILISDSNKFWRVYGDNHAVATTEVGTTVNFSVPMTGAAASDQEVCSYLRNTIAGMCMDNASSYATDESDAVHPDNYQHRVALTAGAQEGPGVIIMEGVQMHSNTQNYTDNSADNKRYALGRQFLQGGNTQKAAPLRIVAVNCIGATFQVRGYDLFNAVEAYLEYNTMAGAARLPPLGPNNNGIPNTPSILSDLTVSNGRLPGVRRARKNILAKAAFSTAAGLFGEDNVIVNWDGTSPGPEAYLVGPFGRDVSNRVTYDMSADSVAFAANSLRKAGWAALQAKPGVDAGARFTSLRLAPGETDTMTAAQAATLVAVTESQPIGSLPGTVALRWNSGASETGGQMGADVTFSVQ